MERRSRFVTILSINIIIIVLVLKERTHTHYLFALTLPSNTAVHNIIS